MAAESTLILMDVILPSGEILPAAIFDDRNYVEITDDWLRRNNPKTDVADGGIDGTSQ